MSGDALSKAFEAAEAFANVETFAASSREVNTGAYRMEGAYYGSAGYRALQMMSQSGLQMTTVGRTATVRWIGPFGRTYVDDPSAGVPFLSSSEMMGAKPEPQNYISKALTRQLADVMVRNGIILISRSGTIGNIALCTEDMDGIAVSEHAIRVIVNDPLDLGCVYAFLSSDVGHFLIKRKKSGSVVESIYEADVSGLPIPLLPKSLRIEMTRLTHEASHLRVQANQLLRLAEEDVWRQNYLEQPTSDEHCTLTCFTCSRKAVDSSRDEQGTVRLDATSYAPLPLALRSRIRACRTWGTLRSLGVRITLLGKTFIPGVYKVEKQYGVPYFTGKELIRCRLIADTFIASRNANHMQKLSAKRGMVLVTCAGTVGRVAYVRGALEGAAITHDAIRLVAGDAVSSGYLFAFLASAAGQLQLAQCSYGSVIPRLHNDHLNGVVMPVPEDRGESIGRRVDEAFDKRTEAQKTENHLVELFSTALRSGRSYVESEWGSEY